MLLDHLYRRASLLHLRHRLRQSEVQPCCCWSQATIVTTRVSIGATFILGACSSHRLFLDRMDFVRLFDILASSHRANVTGIRHSRSTIGFDELYRATALHVSKSIACADCILVQVDVYLLKAATALSSNAM